MGKQEKRIQKLLAQPTRLSWSSIESAPLQAGFALRKGKGSHRIIYRPDDPSLYTTVAIHGGECKPIYKINCKKLYLSVFGS